MVGSFGDSLRLLAQQLDAIATGDDPIGTLQVSRAVAKEYVLLLEQAAEALDIAGAKEAGAG